MTKTDYKKLVDLLNRETVENYKVFKKHYKNNDLSETRFVWDMLWRLPATMESPVIAGFYEYLNDSHVNTALKKYFKENDII